MNTSLASELHTPILMVDYGDVSDTQHILEHNKVDTVISVINSIHDSQPELDLIKAADQASTVRRYIPSAFSIPYKDPGLLKWFPVGADKVKVIAALEQSSLEFSAWYVGYFIDYWLQPHVKSYVLFMKLVLDMEHNKAAIPGTGDEAIVVTYTGDIAKFLVASLSLETWEKETYVVGERTTFNELLKIAEETKSVSFDVSHDSMENCIAGNVTELPCHAESYDWLGKEQAQTLVKVFSRLFAEARCDLPQLRTINEGFPDIKARGARELFMEAYRR